MTVLVATTRTGTAFNKPAYKYIREADRLPSTNSAHEQEDPLFKVKLFNPTGNGIWYIAGYDPESGIAWGAAYIFEFELGDFYMPELVAVRGVFGLPIERDIHWKPQRLSEVSKRFE